VFCAHGQSFVATDSIDGGLSLVPGTFDPKTAATFADFDPLGTSAALYSNGHEATAKLYADASAVANSTEFKVLSLRALCTEARNSAQYSQEANSKALRVWRAILAFVEEDPMLVDVTVLLRDLAYNTTAATVLHTMCRPSLRLLTAVSPSVQKGDLMAFATNYAAATQKMAQGLAPGQRAYFTIAKSVESVSGAESAKSAEAAEAPEATESAEEPTKEREPGESQRKRARTDSTSGLSGLSGRESTVV
jgi:hypothetical protein